MWRKNRYDDRKCKAFLFDKIERLRRLKISPDDDVGRQGSVEVGKEGEKKKKKR